jgi:hypothetical protein
MSTPREGEKGSLQRTINGTELGIEVRAQSVHHRDDGKGDTGGDQAVFDRGRTRLIGQELPENTLQTYLLLGIVMTPTTTVGIPAMI